MTLGRTPSQTVGPYYTIALSPDAQRRLADEGVQLAGRLLDGQGAPINDGLIELWDAAGKRWGRSGTDAEGRFSFVVPKPDRLPGQAPHLAVTVHARGLLRHQLTRVYFPDEAAANADDPVLSSLEPADRETLVAEEDGDGLRFDIRLQGDRATVFFAH